MYIYIYIYIYTQLKNLGRTINQNIYLLNLNEETKKVFRHDLWFHLGVLIE